MVRGLRQEKKKKGMTQSISRTQPAIGGKGHMQSMRKKIWLVYNSRIGPLADNKEGNMGFYTCRALNSANTLSECGSLLLQSLREGAHLRQYLKGDLVRF